MQTRLSRYLLIVAGLLAMCIWPVQIQAESTQEILDKIQGLQDKTNHSAQIGMLCLLATAVVIAISSWRVRKKHPVQSKIGLVFAGILLIGLALWVNNWY